MGGIQPELLTDPRTVEDPAPPDRPSRAWILEVALVVVLALAVFVVHDVGYMLHHPFWLDEAWVALVDPGADPRAPGHHVGHADRLHVPPPAGAGRRGAAVPADPPLLHRGDGRRRLPARPRAAPHEDHHRAPPGGCGAALPGDARAHRPQAVHGRGVRDRAALAPPRPARDHLDPPPPRRARRGGCARDAHRAHHRLHRDRGVPLARDRGARGDANGAGSASSPSSGPWCSCAWARSTWPSTSGTSCRWSRSTGAAGTCPSIAGRVRCGTTSATGSPR